MPSVSSSTHSSLTKVTVTKHNEIVAHDGRTRCVTIGPYSGLVLATGGDDNCINIWRLGKPSSILSFRDQKRAITALAFSPQERYLAIGSEGGAVKVISMATQKTKCTIPGAHKTFVTTIAWLPEHTSIVATGGADGRVTLIDIHNASIVNTFQYRSTNGGSVNKGIGEITCIKFAPNGKWLAVGDSNGRIILYELQTGRTLVCWERTSNSTINGTNNTAQNSSTNDQQQYHIPASSSSSSSSIVPTNDTFNNNGHRGAVTTIDFHPTELILVSGGSDHTVRFWSLDPSNRWGLLATSPADTGTIKSVAFITPREHQLENVKEEDIPLCIAVAAITDAHVRIWTIPTLWDSNVTDATYTLDMVDTRGWNGATTSWIGANIRSTTSNNTNQQKNTDNTLSGTSNLNPFSHLQLVVACIENSFMRAYGLDLGLVAPLNGNLNPLTAESRSTLLSSSSSNSNPTGNNGNNNNYGSNSNNGGRSISRGPNRPSHNSGSTNVSSAGPASQSKRSVSRRERKEEEEDDNNNHHEKNIQEIQQRYMNIGPSTNPPRSNKSSYRPPPRVAHINLYSNNDDDDDDDDHHDSDYDDDRYNNSDYDDDDPDDSGSSPRPQDRDNDYDIPSPPLPSKTYTKPAALSVYRQLLEKNMGKNSTASNEESKEYDISSASSSTTVATVSSPPSISSSSSIITNPTVTPVQPSQHQQSSQRRSVVPNMEGVNAALLQVASIKTMVTNISQQQQQQQQQQQNKPTGTAVTNTGNTSNNNNVILDKEIHVALGITTPFSPSSSMIPTTTKDTNDKPHMGIVSFDNSSASPRIPAANNSNTASPPTDASQRSRGSSIESLGGISEFRPLTANGSAGPPLTGLPTELLVQYSNKKPNPVSNDRTDIAISSPKFTIDDLHDTNHESKTETVINEESKMSSPYTVPSKGLLFSPSGINLNASLGIGLDEITAAIQQQENMNNNPVPSSTVFTKNTKPVTISSPEQSSSSSTSVTSPPLASSPPPVLVPRSSNLIPIQPRALGDFVPSTRNHPVGIAFEAFLPDNNASGFGESRVQPLVASQAFYRDNELNSFEERITSSIQTNRDSYLRKLRKRCKTITIAAQMWKDGDSNSSMDYITDNNSYGSNGVWDMNVIADILSVITGTVKELRPSTKQDIFGLSVPNSIQIIPCSLSGSGTGTFESLLLNLEKSLAILHTANVTVNHNLVDDVTLTITVYAISTIFRAFASHIRTTRTTYLGPVSSSATPNDIHISDRTLDSLRIEPGIEDRLKRCGTAIEYLENIRNRLVPILSSQNKGLNKNDNGSNKDTNHNNVIKQALLSAVKSYMLQYESWRSTL